MVEELGKEELEEYLEKIEDMLENDDMIEKMAPEVLAEYDKLYCLMIISSVILHVIFNIIQIILFNSVLSY